MVDQCSICSAQLYEEPHWSYYDIGKGAIQAISQKQKINTKSSTKSELVGPDDTLSHYYGLNIYGRTRL